MPFKISVGKMKNVIVLCMLFLAAMNFAAKFFYFAFFSLFCVMLIQRNLMVNGSTIVYLLLGTLMAVYNTSEGVLSMIRCMSCVALYLVGYNMVLNKTTRTGGIISGDLVFSEKQGSMLLITVAVGSFLHYILNFVYNYNNLLGRNTNDIWSGEMMAATGQATLAYLMLGLTVAAVFLPRKKVHRWMGAICIIGMFAYNMVLAVRTMIVILLVLLFVAWIYTSHVLKKSYEKVKFNVGVCLTVLVGCLTLFFAWGLVDEFILKSNLFERIIETSMWDTGGRENAKLAYIRNAFKYPLGGMHLREQYGYAHDLLLDGFDEYGMIGFALLLIIVVLGIVELYKFIRRTSYSKEVKLSFLCVYIAILLVFSVEPILVGMQWLFSCFCMINGAVTAMNISYRKSKRLAL